MTAEPDQILHQLFSPAFPVGAFAWSHGFEAAIATGAVHDPASAQDWIAAALSHGAGWSDVVIAAHAARGGDAADLSALALALAPTAERRAESLEQGTAFSSTVRAVWGVAVPDGPLPVSAGLSLCALGLPVEAGLRLFLQGFASNLVSACVRAVPLGQTDGQRISAALQPLVRDLAARAASADLDDVGGFVPALDIASARHETLQPRIFRS